jgi:hypothetical protein
MSSKSPSIDEVSEFEISPTKMSSNQTEKGVDGDKPLNAVEETPSFLDNFKSAKLYLLISRGKHESDLSHDLKSKFHSALLLFLCFTLSLPLITTNSSLILLAVYMATALTDLLISGVSMFSNMTPVTHYLWTATLACATLAQPWVLSFGASKLPEYSFQQWARCSVIVMVLSAAV